MMQKIVLAKLTTGEFIVGEEDVTGIINAFLVTLKQATADGGFRPLLMSYMAPFADSKQTTDFTEDKIMARINCPDSVQDVYMMHTTGIVRATTLPGILQTTR